MQKLSAHQVLAVLSEVPTALRKLASERDDLQSEVQSLRTKLAEFELKDKVATLTQEIHDKGLEHGRSQEETEKFLMQKAADGQLDVVSQAVEFTATSSPIGHLGNTPTGSPEATFEAKLLGS